jgi:hypothetical protein
MHIPAFAADANGSLIVEDQVPVINTLRSAAADDRSTAADVAFEERTLLFNIPPENVAIALVVIVGLVKVALTKFISLFKFSNNASTLARPTLFVPIVKNPPFVIMSLHRFISAMLGGSSTSTR